MTIEARFAVLVLGAMGLLAIAGTIALAILDKQTPDVLQVVIGAAVAGVTGILVPSTPAAVIPVEGRHER